MQLYRRPGTDIWWCSFGAHGKRVRKSTGEVKKALAEKAAAKLQVEYTPDAARGTAYTVGDALDHYSRYLEGRRSQDILIYLRKALLTPEGAHSALIPETLPVMALTPQHIQRVVSHLRSSGRSAETIRSYVTMLRAAVRRAARAGAPMPAAMTLPGAWETPRITRKTRYLTPAEVSAIIKQLSLKRQTVARRDAADLVVSLVSTGARWIEMASLRWDQVDTDQWEVITLRSAKSEGKASRDRLVPIAPPVAAILKARFEALPEKDPSPFVFHTLRKDGGNGRYVAQVILAAINECGLNDDPEIIRLHGPATVHTLRHTAASWLLQSGQADLLEIQALLGHAQPTMTQRYAHLAKGKMVRRLGGVMGALLPPLPGHTD